MLKITAFAVVAVAVLPSLPAFADCPRQTTGAVSVTVRRGDVNASGSSGINCRLRRGATIHVNRNCGCSGGQPASGSCTVTFRVEGRNVSASFPELRGGDCTIRRHSRCGFRPLPGRTHCPGG